MNGYKIIKIKNHPELISRAADWFHEKWYVPVEEYRNSMEASMQVVSLYHSGIWWWKTAGHRRSRSDRK